MKIIIASLFFALNLFMPTDSNEELVLAPAASNSPAPLYNVGQLYSQALMAIAAAAGVPTDDAIAAVAKTGPGLTFSQSQELLVKNQGKVQSLVVDLNGARAIAQNLQSGLDASNKKIEVLNKIDATFKGVIGDNSFGVDQSFLNDENVPSQTKEAVQALAQKNADLSNLKDALKTLAQGTKSLTDSQKLALDSLSSGLVAKLSSSEQGALDKGAIDSLEKNSSDLTAEQRILLSNKFPTVLTSVEDGSKLFKYLDNLNSGTAVAVEDKKYLENKFPALKEFSYIEALSKGDLDLAALNKDTSKSLSDLKRIIKINLDVERQLGEEQVKNQSLQDSLNKAQQKHLTFQENLIIILASVGGPVFVALVGIIIFKVARRKKASAKVMSELKNKLDQQINNVEKKPDAPVSAAAERAASEAVKSVQAAKTPSEATEAASAALGILEKLPVAPKEEQARRLAELQTELDELTEEAPETKVLKPALVSSKRSAKKVVPAPPVIKLNADALKNLTTSSSEQSVDVKTWVDFVEKANPLHSKTRRKSKPQN